MQRGFLHLITFVISFGSFKRFSQQFFILNDVDCDIVINKAEDIQIDYVDWAFNFHNVFFPHLIAFCIFDDCNAAI